MTYILLMSNKCRKDWFRLVSKAVSNLHLNFKSRQSKELKSDVHRKKNEFNLVVSLLVIGSK